MRHLACLVRGLGTCVLTALSLAYMPITIFVMIGVVALFFAHKEMKS